MPLSSTALGPLGVVQNVVPGRTVLAAGVVPGLPASTYGVPYMVESVTSAATVFGAGRFTRGIAELFRQHAPSVLAIALSTEDDMLGLFDYMIDQPFDILVPVGLTATSQRCQDWGNFAYTREQRGAPIMIVASADPSPGISTLVNAPVAQSAGVILTDTAPILKSRYLVLTLDQVTINPNVPSQYVADAAPSIAGLIAATPVQESISYKSLRGLNCLPQYTPAQMQTLASAGYTVLTKTARHGVVPFLGVTATSDQPNSPFYSANYHKLQTMRTVEYVAQRLKAAMQDQVGEAVGSQVRKQVDGVMRILQDEGVILAYDADVQIAAIAGTITVDLAVLPPYETTMVSVTARIRSVRR